MYSTDQFLSFFLLLLLENSSAISAPEEIVLNYDPHTMSAAKRLTCSFRVAWLPTTSPFQGNVLVKTLSLRHAIAETYPLQLMKKVGGREEWGGGK